MTKRFGKLFILAGVLSATVSFARAEDPCAKDRVLTCSDTAPGDGRVHDCLVGRKDKIAPACAMALDRADELAAAVVEGCKADAHRWCSLYATAGRPAIIQCLKENKDKVNSTCKSKYRQFKAFGFDIRS